MCRGSRDFDRHLLISLVDGIAFHYVLHVLIHSGFGNRFFLLPTTWGRNACHDLRSLSPPVYTRSFIPISTMHVIPRTRMLGDCVVQSLTGLKGQRPGTHAVQVSTFLSTSLPHLSAAPVSRTVGNRLPPGLTRNSPNRRAVVGSTCTAFHTSSQT